MTPQKEDYVKELYKLGAAEQRIGNKNLAEVLKVTPPSVTEMLGKLQREGLIEYEPYKGSRLTQVGIEKAIALLRGHRLWEVFLMRHLGYTWSEAHEDAELLEHTTPSRLIGRLDHFLNYPAYCPHGSAIPHPDGSVEVTKLIPMNQLQPGDNAVIRRVTEESELMDYLQNLGVTIGSRVIFVEAAPYEGPVTLLLDGKNIQVSYKATCKIYVDANSV